MTSAAKEFFRVDIFSMGPNIILAVVFISTKNFIIYPDKFVFLISSSYLCAQNREAMNIALVAHDSRKEELIEWVKYNKDFLAKHELFATGTTGRLLENEVFTEHKTALNVDDLILTKKVNKLLSGPLGGDAQIGAMIAEGSIDCLIFFCDNLIVQGHNNDVLGLSRLASLYNIAYATNRTTADLIISSPLFGSETYQPIIPHCIEKYQNRTLNE